MARLEKKKTCSVLKKVFTLGGFWLFWKTVNAQVCLKEKKGRGTCSLSLQRRSWSSNTGIVSRWKMEGMSKVLTDPFCLVPLRQKETRLDGSEGIRLLSAHSVPEKRWCKRCNTPMGNLIQTLLPAVILLLLGKIAE